MRTPARLGRFGLLALSASVGALVLGLVPGATSASAEPTGPVVNYIDYQVAGARSVGSAQPNGTSATTLTPAGYLVYEYAVSADGSTLLVGLGHGSTTTPANDRTYALVLVHRTAEGTTSTILTNSWDVEPALSADGSVAWWMCDGKVWKYANGVSTRLTDSLFAPPAGMLVAGFSVSPDGSEGAVVYREDAQTGGTWFRVLAADFTAGKDQAYLDWWGALDAFWVGPTWLDTSTLLITYDWNGVSNNATFTLSAAGGSGGQTTAYGTPGLYDVQQLGSTWWAWRGDTTSTYTTVATPEAFADATFTPFPLSSTTAYYRPSAVTPPAMAVPTNKATAFARLYLSASTVKYGARAVYDSYAEYLTALPGETFENDASWVARGALQYSIDGATWRALTTTSWARAVPWPGSTDKGTGYTHALKRNTWFRWIYPGDWFTTSAVSRTVLVKVTPVVTAKVAYYGRYRTVYGAASRSYGTAVLYRVSGTRLIKIATARIASNGAYNFGKRLLPRAYYRVYTVADRYWATGVSAKLYVR